MHDRLWMLIGLSLLLVLQSGCSFSYSSKSSSDSSASSSDSSASSSGSSANRTEAYEADVRDYTSAYVRSGGDFNSFMAGLGNVASKHGITNWEADNATYVGIGRGLKAANVTQLQVDVYKTNLSKGDATKAAAIQQGYDKGE